MTFVKQVTDPPQKNDLAVFVFFLSRSASLILAYLIARKKMTLKQAVDTVR
jgi:hypothetical protein